MLNVNGPHMHTNPVCQYITLLGAFGPQTIIQNPQYFTCVSL